MREYLVSVDHTAPERQLEGVDYIYVLNLDESKDRLKNIVDELAAYKLVPQRLSAVQGRKLTPEVFEALGLRLEPGMRLGDWAVDFSAPGEGEFVYLGKEHYGRVFYSKKTYKGAVGCTLSHLSAIQDGYDRGYETVWILEDDVEVVQDPHVLVDLMKKLGEWDVLYTDSDTERQAEWPFSVEDVLWRPDRSQLKLPGPKVILDSEFEMAGIRFGALSYIIKRSGMKKILDFYAQFPIFLPWDLELSLIPDLKKYNLRKPVATLGRKFPSDILPRGWVPFNEREMADRLMETVHEIKPQLVVEVGFFSPTSWAIAKALSENKQGTVQTFCAHNDFLRLKKTFEEGLQQMGVDSYCKVEGLADPSLVPNSVDLLFCESRFRSAYDEVVAFFPKVKPNGLIYLSSANHDLNRFAVAYLMQRCTYLPEKSIGIDLVCFQKR